MRTERTFLGRALTYIGKRVGYATRGHSLHFQAVTSRRRFGLRLTALGSGLGAGTAAAAGAAAAGLGRRLGENSVQGHVRGGCECWRWRQRKRAKRREDEGVRDGGREREREREQVGVCPCAGTTDCTALYRATSRNHPSLLRFSIPYSLHSPS